MRIVGTRREGDVTVTTITCKCGKSFEHCSNRSRISCPRCGHTETLQEVRSKHNA